MQMEKVGKAAEVGQEEEDPESIETTTADWA